MKKISILIPTYNEEDNVVLLYDEIMNVWKQHLSDYLYEIVFIDNFSSDNTRILIGELCEKDSNVKAIFNSKNFGPIKSPHYGMLQTTGDCTILLCADFQDPVSLIIDFVREWELGYKIVVGIKNKSKENKLMYFIRSSYYKFFKKVGDIEHISQFTGFGLYDIEFIKVLKELDDPLPYFRGIVAELGYRRKEIPYEQAERKAGKSSFNFLRMYDYAMLGITSYSKVVMRLATMVGFLAAIVSLIVAMITLIVKLINWNNFPVGIAAISIGVFFFGSVQLFFIGLLGEYVLNINTRVMKRPLVIEEQRINFNDSNRN